MDPELKARLLQSIQNGLKIDRPIEAGDENKPADNSVRNMLVQKMGLPDSMMQSAADEKRAYADMPKAMGMGTMGTVGKANAFTGEAAQAMAKLQAAKSAGQKLPASMEYLLGKATGSVPVVKTAQEVAEESAKKAASLAGDMGPDAAAKFANLKKFMGGQ
jgi:hypothetical protein